MAHSAEAVEAAELAISAPAGGGGAFEIVSAFEPAGDQPEAIEQLIAGVREGERDQVLLGVTGSGKTFTITHVIRALCRPTLILAPNKTLAAQLYGEMKDFLAQQRHRILRILLRLLSAGGLRTALGHLYRERLLHQRAYRPHAPQRDAGAAGARGRGDRGLGLVHLWHRRGRDLLLHGGLAGIAGSGRPARAHPQADRPAVPAHQRDAGARQLPRARRRDRALPPPTPRIAPGASRSSATRSKRSSSSIR